MGRWESLLAFFCARADVLPGGLSRPEADARKAGDNQGTSAFGGAPLSARSFLRFASPGARTVGCSVLPAHGRCSGLVLSPNVRDHPNVRLCIRAVWFCDADAAGGAGAALPPGVDGEGDSRREGASGGSPTSLPPPPAVDDAAQLGRAQLLLEEWAAQDVGFRSALEQSCWAAHRQQYVALKQRMCPGSGLEGAARGAWVQVSTCSLALPLGGIPHTPGLLVRLTTRPAARPNASEARAPAATAAAAAPTAAASGLGGGASPGADVREHASAQRPALAGVGSRAAAAAGRTGPEPSAAAAAAGSGCGGDEAAVGARLAAVARSVAAEVLPTGIMAFAYGSGSSLVEVSYLNARAREYLCMSTSVAGDAAPAAASLRGLPAKALLAAILQYEPHVVRQLHRAAASEQGFCATVQVPAFLDSASLGHGQDVVRRSDRGGLISLCWEEEGEGGRPEEGFMATVLHTISDISQCEEETADEEGEGPVERGGTAGGRTPQSGGPGSSNVDRRSSGWQGARPRGRSGRESLLLSASASRTSLHHTKSRTARRGSVEPPADYLGAELRMLSRAVLSMHGDHLRPRPHGGAPPARSSTLQAAGALRPTSQKDVRLAGGRGGCSLRSTSNGLGPGSAGQAPSAGWDGTQSPFEGGGRWPSHAPTAPPALDVEEQELLQRLGAVGGSRTSQPRKSGSKLLEAAPSRPGSSTLFTLQLGSNSNGSQRPSEGRLSPGGDYVPPLPKPLPAWPQQAKPPPQHPHAAEPRTLEAGAGAQAGVAGPGEARVQAGGEGAALPSARYGASGRRAVRRVTTMASGHIQRTVAAAAAAGAPLAGAAMRAAPVVPAGLGFGGGGGGPQLLSPAARGSPLRRQLAAASARLNPVPSFPAPPSAGGDGGGDGARGPADGVHAPAAGLGGHSPVLLARVALFGSGDGATAGGGGVPAAAEALAHLQAVLGANRTADDAQPHPLPSGVIEGRASADSWARAESGEHAVEVWAAAAARRPALEGAPHGFARGAGGRGVASAGQQRIGRALWLGGGGSQRALSVAGQQAAAAADAAAVQQRQLQHQQQLLHPAATPSPALSALPPSLSALLHRHPSRLSVDSSGSSLWPPQSGITAARGGDGGASGGAGTGAGGGGGEGAAARRGESFGNGARTGVALSVGALMALPGHTSSGAAGSAGSSGAIAAGASAGPARGQPGGIVDTGGSWEGAPLLSPARQQPFGAAPSSVGSRLGSTPAQHTPTTGGGGDSARSAASHAGLRANAAGAALSPPARPAAPPLSSSGPHNVPRGNSVRARVHALLDQVEQAETLRSGSGGTAANVRPPSTTNIGGALVLATTARMSADPPRAAAPPHGTPYKTLPRVPPSGTGSSHHSPVLNPSSLASLGDPTSSQPRVQLLGTTEDCSAATHAHGSGFRACDAEWSLLASGSSRGGGGGRGGGGAGASDAAAALSGAAAGPALPGAAGARVQVVELLELAGAGGSAGGTSDVEAGGGSRGYGALGALYGHAAAAPVAGSLVVEEADGGRRSPLRVPETAGGGGAGHNSGALVAPSVAGAAAPGAAQLPPPSSPRAPAAAAAGACAGVLGAGGAAAAAIAPLAWYQLRARTCTTVDGGRVLLLMLSDVTAQTQLQERVTTLVEQEHRILEALFPRHVIAYLTAPTTAGEDGCDAPSAPSPLHSSARKPSRRRRRRRSSALAEGEGARGGTGSGCGTGGSSRIGTGNGYSAASGGGTGGTGDSGGGGAGSRPALARSPTRLGARQGSGSASQRRGQRQLRQMAAAQQQQMVKVSRLATEHRMITILFTDVVGFTAMSRQVAPIVVMRFLNELYQKLDALVDIMRVYKVETIGDCYVVAGGLVRYDSDGYCSVLPEGEVDELHAVRVMEFAKAMLRVSRQVLMPTTGQPVELRLGLHSGPAMSGVVGHKMPRFTVFGETVEAANKMESSGKSGRIHVSGVTRALLRQEEWEPTAGVQIEGRGLMDTFLWLQGEEEDASHKQRVAAVYL